MVEPKRVNSRPFRVEPRVRDRNSIAGLKSDNCLLGRIDDAVHAPVCIGKFEYRIDLSGVRAVEPDTQDFSVAASLNTRRYGHSGTVLVDGRYAGWT